MLKKLRMMGYTQDLMEGGFLATAEDLIRPEVQISDKIVPLTDFEVNPLNDILEVWVPQSTSRLMLSLVVQLDGKHD